jgi:predicted dehydrogenase
MGVMRVTIPYEPRFPDGDRPGIGIVGCGGIVKLAHLPAYEKYGLHVAGVYDIAEEATRSVRERFGIETIYPSLDALLDDPAVGVVDIATHPAQRVAIIRRALAAGKHVLAQKPLAPDLAGAREAVADAERRGLTLAVNQNGRWAPAWRIATLLVERGEVGDVLAVTHLFDAGFGWVAGTAFDAIPHWAIYDYAIHWIDITRCWLQEKRPVAVRAREYRTPNQPVGSRAAWGAWIEVAYADGSSGLIRSIGGSATTTPGHPFWIHGTAGTIRGSALGEDAVEIERDGTTRRWRLRGAWFPDGFAGAMGELMYAVAEGREPYNSARHNLLSLEMTLAACRSAELDGAPVPVGDETP